MFNNTGDDEDLNGVLLLNQGHAYTESYIQLGQNVMTFRYFNQSVDDNLDP